MTEGETETTETLQELFRLRQHQLGDLTVHEVWKRCRGQASWETFRRIEAGTRTRIKSDTVNALALALDVEASRVLKAAKQRPRLGRFEAPDEWDQLYPSERQVLYDMGRIILEARTRNEDPPATLYLAGEKPDRQRGRVTRAARRRPTDQEQ